MRSDDAIDAALRQVAGQDATGDALDDGLLLAYRDGTLPADRVAEVDLILARDPEARALLAELSRPVDARLEERLLGRPGAGRRRAGLAIVALAAAAAVLAVVLSKGPARVDGPPAYALEVQGFVAEVRGEPPRTQQLRGDSRLTIRLRPAVPQQTTPAFGVWIARPGGVLAPVQGQLSSDRGAFQWSAAPSEIFGAAPGSFVVAVHLTHAAVDPIAGLTLEAAQREHPGLGWWLIPVEYLGAAP